MSEPRYSDNKKHNKPLVVLALDLSVKVLLDVDGGVDFVVIHAYPSTCFHAHVPHNFFASLVNWTQHVLLVPTLSQTKPMLSIRLFGSTSNRTRARF